MRETTAVAILNNNDREFGEPSKCCPKARFGAGKGLPRAQPELSPAKSLGSTTSIRSGGFGVKHEEVIKRVDGSLADLETALASGKSEALCEYLAFLSRFHSYSFRNVMLIFMQRPDASMVAGFHSWKSMNRSVKKGEKGIRILAPLVRKREQAESNGEQDDKSRNTIYGYRTVSVFDVSQTDGDALPSIRGYTGDPAENLERLKSFVESKDIELLWESPGGGALAVSLNGMIKVTPGLEPADSFAALVHEVAHELMHKGERRLDTTKSIRETEAEAVAFAVCSAIGIEPGDSAADYIQLHQGDVELLKASLELIRSTASQILSALSVDLRVEVR